MVEEKTLVFLMGLLILAIGLVSMVPIPEKQVPTMTHVSLPAEPINSGVTASVAVIGQHYGPSGYVSATINVEKED